MHKLFKLVSLGGYYVIFIKIRFNDNSFSMAGSQFAYYSRSNASNLDLWSAVKERVGILLDQYSFNASSITYIQLNFTSMNKVLHTRYLVDTSKRSRINTFLKYNFDTKSVLPVSIDFNAFDTKIYKDVINDRIVNIKFWFKGELIEFRKYIESSVKNSKFSNLDSNYNFYLVSKKKKRVYNVVGIKVISNTEVNKLRFSVGGVLLEDITDTVLEDGVVKREVNNNVLIIKGDRVMKGSRKIP